ncbi:MAG: hypothetical protein Rhims3KO_03420 [Hyphomicrobiales bacterium]
MRTLLISAFLLCATASAVSAQDWQLQQLGAVNDSVFAERCSRAPSGLPDGCVVRGNGDVRSAWYVAPTTRYAHGILGDAIEAGGLRVELASGAQTTLSLPDDQVFEDRTPRLADLDSDGRTEIITIRSSTRLGGSVAVYGVRGEALVELGATPYIGRSNRWLNIAGIADFTGQGGLQVAFVETPHIGGTLKLAAFHGNAMQVVAQIGGFSNHGIRSREQRLSAVADVDSDGLMDIILPNARRDQILAVTFRPNVLRLAQLPIADTIEQLANDGQSRRTLVRTRNGSVWQIGW